MPFSFLEIFGFLSRTVDQWGSGWSSCWSSWRHPLLWACWFRGRLSCWWLARSLHKAIWICSISWVSPCSPRFSVITVDTSWAGGWDGVSSCGIAHVFIFKTITWIELTATFPGLADLPSLLVVGLGFFELLVPFWRGRRACPSSSSSSTVWRVRASGRRLWWQEGTCSGTATKSVSYTHLTLPTNREV